MSVLACNRYGCGNVMCDRLSPLHGYLCNDCFSELSFSGAITHWEIEEFMRTPPGAYKTDGVSFCHNAFPLA